MNEAPPNLLHRWRAQAREFFSENALAEGRPLSPGRRLAHFWLMVFRGFAHNRCPARASALAYTTLLALVPLLAVALSVAASLLQNEGERPIRAAIDQLVSGVAPALDLEIKGEGADSSRKDEVVTKITDFIHNIRTGTLGVVGMVALVFVCISLLRTVEAAFNDIWGVQRGRTWMASIVQYWAVISLGPVLLVVAVSLTSGSHFSFARDYFTRLPIVVVAAIFSVLPFVLVTIVFTLLYRLMPNTRVQFLPALAGGALAAFLWALNGHLNTLYLSRVVTYNKIYGSLGILPLFLVGLFFSWLILLFGAQVAYACQNRHAYLQEKQAEAVTQRGREFIALRLMAHIGSAFVRGEGARAADRLAVDLGVSPRLVAQLLHRLMAARLLVETGEGGAAFMAARPLEQITLHDITQAIRAGAGQEPATREDALRPAVREEFERVAGAEREAGAGRTLRDVVGRG